MYSIKVQPPNVSYPVIDRSMSSNSEIELIPVLVEICRSTFDMSNPVAVSMGSNVYHIFSLDNPLVYAKVSVIKDVN